MTVSALLSAAAAKVSTPATWCQHANARNASGVWVPYDHSTATAWDIFGALKIAQIQGSYSMSDFHGAYAHVRAKIPSTFHNHNQDIEYYNDTITFSEVAGIFA